MHTNFDFENSNRQFALIPIPQEMAPGRQTMYVRPIFGYRLAELGNFWNLMIFFQQIDSKRRRKEQMEAIIIKKQL